MRFLFYSHDGFGLGHTRRHLAVAAALTELARDAAVLLVTGADDVERLGLPPRIEIVKLPGLRKVANEEYVSRRLSIPTSEIRELRSDLLLTTVKSFKPSVILVDKHPFGARGEFKAGLKALRRQGGRAALGLRDILDEPQHVLAEWRRHKMLRRIEELYDRVLVYGERAIFDPISAYAFPPALAQRTRFCGYVLSRESTEALRDFKWPFPPREERTRPVVLATTGGGEDGFRVLETFIRAANGAAWQAVAITGPMTPDAELARLKELASASEVALRSFVPHLSALFPFVDALVCMGGYNTLTECISQGVPTVCVPRVVPRTEQLIRARAFEQLDLLRAVPPAQLDPENLRREIELALKISSAELQKRAQALIDFDGARVAATELLALATVENTSLVSPAGQLAS